MIASSNVISSSSWQPPAILSQNDAAREGPPPPLPPGAGLTNTTPNPEGGEYVKDDQGNLTGQLNEGAAFQAFAVLIPPPTVAELEQAFVDIQRDFSNAGITTAGDMTTGGSYGFDLEIGLLRKLAPTSPIRLRS